MYRARQAFFRLDPSGIRPTGIVLGVIAALFFGAQLVNALIPTPGVALGPGSGPGSGPVPPIVAPGEPSAPSGPGTRPLPPGSVLTAGPLRIPLVAGWQPAATPSSGAAATIVKGAVQIDLFTATISGGTATPAAVYNSYISFIGSDQNGNPRPGFTSAQPASTAIGPAVAAARGAYTGIFGGNQIEGEVTAFVTGTSDGWIWDAWGTAGTLGSLLPEVHSMIDNMQLGGGGG